MNRFFTLRRAAHASPVAIALLIAANAVPLVGVLFLGWDLATLVAVYWAENGVVGVFAAGKILTAGNEGPLAFTGVPIRAVLGPALGPALGPTALGPAAPTPPTQAPQPPPPPPSPGAARLPSAAVARAIMVPFFCVHYGMFWLVHGVFVWAALPVMFAAAAGVPATGPDPSVVLYASLFMLASHGASFVFNWLLGGEYATSSPAAEMAAPYGRVVILHLTIIFGAFAVAFLGAPIGALVVMVVLKTGVDLAAHLAERERAATRAG